MMGKEKIWNVQKIIFFLSFSLYLRDLFIVSILTNASLSFIQRGVLPLSISLALMSQIALEYIYLRMFLLRIGLLVTNRNEF